MIPGYFGGIIEAGGLPVMLPLTSENAHIEQITEMCSGFLFIGGQDVSPEIYSARRIGACGECSPERDAMETLLLKYAMQLDKPILGICRGIQFINASSAELSGRISPHSFRIQLHIVRKRHMMFQAMKFILITELRCMSCSKQMSFPSTAIIIRAYVCCQMS